MLIIFVDNNVQPHPTGAVDDHLEVGESFELNFHALKMYHIEQAQVESIKVNSVSKRASSLRGLVVAAT